MRILKLAGHVLSMPLLALMIFANAAAAGDTNLTFQGIAIQGYDPVAYFTEGMPVPGDANITATHDGAIYRFASAGHKAVFEADPARYAPLYGGYCAYAAAQGAKASIEPEQFTVFKGRLYLNYNADVHTRWNQDRETYVSKADAYWASK